jgi:magnesium chelatase family protein
MLGRTKSVALTGIEGRVIDVEADAASGLPAFLITGLPDAALGEARDRVRAAINNSGLPFSLRRLTVNLSPASFPKTGTSFDLAIAIAVLTASDLLPAGRVKDVVHLGELGLDGRVRPVRGVLPAVLAAVSVGLSRVVVAHANATEARLVKGAEVLSVGSLAEVVGLYRGEPVPDQLLVDLHDLDRDLDLDPAKGSHSGAVLGHRLGPATDLADVAGQEEARRAVEVAAAGGHHLFLVGPPGAGKTMLAARLPGLLPDLDEEVALQVTAVHSLVGHLPGGHGLITRPPYIDPHHTASVAAVVGGGSGLPRPGAISLAHGGVLFLDEAPEWNRATLDALRQPLESGRLTIHRSKATATYPARFQLVLAANPCPCGRATGGGRDCTCTPMAQRGYLRRLSGPLLDRVDLQISVRAVTRAAIRRAGSGESTAIVAARVAAARGAQLERLAGTGWRCNAEVPGTDLTCGAMALDASVTSDLELAMDRGTLTVRGYHRVLRVAWTLADLDGRTAPSRAEVGLAVELRHQSRAAA